VRSPVYLVGSTPPNVSSPFLTGSAGVGSKDAETRLDAIAPLLKRLSVTVGISFPMSGIRVPIVRSTGPRLQTAMT